MDDWRRREIATPVNTVHRSLEPPEDGLGTREDWDEIDCVGEFID